MGRVTVRRRLIEILTSSCDGSTAASALVCRTPSRSVREDDPVFGAQREGQRGPPPAFVGDTEERSATAELLTSCRGESHRQARERTWLPGGAQEQAAGRVLLPPCPVSCKTARKNCAVGSGVLASASGRRIRRASV